MIAEHELLHSPYALKVVMRFAEYIRYIGRKIYRDRYGYIEYAAPKERFYSVLPKRRNRRADSFIFAVSKRHILFIPPYQRHEKQHRKANARIDIYPFARRAKAEEQARKEQRFKRFLQAVAIKIHAIILIHIIIHQYYKEHAVNVYGSYARLRIMHKVERKQSGRKQRIFAFLKQPLCKRIHYGHHAYSK